MTISYNWLKDYIRTSLTPEEVAGILTAIGLEVESVEAVESVKGGLSGVVVGEVLTCEPHPDADRLRVTRVDAALGEPLQIVCGAPNVAAGQKVLVATIGTTLYPTSGDSFIIKKSKIRGVESHGMICASDELGIGADHSGILVLEGDYVNGTPAIQALKLPTDTVLSIGLTPNRTDAFSHIGVAREVAAALGHMEGREPVTLSVAWPELPAKLLTEGQSLIDVKVVDERACPRYTGITIRNLRVEPSPDWMQQRLSAIGVRPINNIVDITNYVQHECGQPLHAFDADKIAGQQVVVRKATKGERFVTLDGVERTLHEDDLVIADSNKPMCLAGIFGGLDSGVSDQTSRIFLESAWFHSTSVRKTARRHGLHTDSSFRFERGIDPSRVMWALQRAAQMIVDIAGGEIDASASDHYPRPAVPVRVTLRYARVNALIGKEIAAVRIRGIVESLGFSVVSESSTELILDVPLYRVEVTREVDVIEEILRINGYDAVDFPKQMRSALSQAPKPDPERIRERISDALASRGFNEIMGMSMTRSKYLNLRIHPDYDETTAVKLLNPLSSDLGVMRQTLLFEGLKAIQLNRNHRQSDLRLFEFGKEYRKSDDRVMERQKLSILMSGRRQPESWNTSNDMCSFIDLKSAVELVMRLTGIVGTRAGSVTHPHFNEGMEWSRGKDVLVRAGAVHPLLLKEFDISDEVWFADFDWDVVLTCLPSSEITYRAPEKYPAVRRDLSLLLDRQVRFGDIEAAAFGVDRKLLREVNLFDVYEGKNLAEGKKSYAVSFVIQDSSRTMTDAQVDGIMEKIRSVLEEKLGATLR